jgi:ribosomal protein L7/L12
MSDDVRRSIGEAEIVRRLRLLEAKMDLVLKTLNIEFVEDTSGYMGQVNALVAQGKLLDAIKVYREATGASMVEAQAIIQGIPKTKK